MERSRPVLLVVPSLREAWEDAIAPWFERVLPETWKRTLPSLVVVPTRGQANDLKARLIAKGYSHLGLQFVTPASLWALLARDDATPHAQPEHLRLLLALAHYRVRWSTLATVVSPAQRGRACGKRYDRGRRTGWRLFRYRPLLDRVVGRSLRRSATRAKIGTRA